MNLNRTRVKLYLNELDFEDLFIEELGWDNYGTNLDIEIDENRFTLEAIAEKRGVVVFSCDDIPPYATRKKIDRLVTQSFREHFIIYISADKTEQILQWVRREVGKPLASREHRYNIKQPGESLIQKLQAIAFSFEEEEDLTVVDVTSRVRAAFNVERVTKKFYERFKKERLSFQKFLEGIPDEKLEPEYVSIMLNRLMFIYFIQKKGFLGGDHDYLRNKLALSQQRGKSRFYRDFLCPLFFEGFAKTVSARAPNISALLGDIPYLNGGIFQRHEVEQLHGKKIQIPDVAFERLFYFFEQYQWHLDERPLRNDNEINPDVLGYIFEKYINQKQMGAYYTKEDITGYISKNTIIPYLFDAAQKKCRIAFEGENSVWTLLTIEPDRYIYDAVRKGTDLDLPPEIAAGIDDVSQRGLWNTKTPEEYALPTEIWRETVARRLRYEEVRKKLTKGEVRSINDFITYNLDIQQFAQDVIENCEEPELLRAFWKAITELTVLDPTCGSGAFLFAALNILEPLYEACLDRMEVFVAELSHGKHHPHKYIDFRSALDKVKRHPNQRYFIFKSIVINNLYGVDIMPEAVEIAKLRLFLKLVSQVDRVENIEPLPDIDFNIRAGNTLVGFTNIDEVERAMTTTPDGQIKLLSPEDKATIQLIKEKAEDVERLFCEFRGMQTKHDMHDYTQDFIDTKEELRKRLKALEDELNRYLALEYGVNMSKPKEYQNWLASHQPFHWFIDFYGILQRGGFDVIIGNPPYVSTRKIEYSIPYATQYRFSDIYAYMLIRSASIRRKYGFLGMIVPLSITFSRFFERIREELYLAGTSWLSSFDNIPAAIFSGVSQRCTICINHQSNLHQMFVSPMYRWRSEYRPILTNRIEYIPVKDFKFGQFGIPKLSSKSQCQTLDMLDKTARIQGSTLYSVNSKNVIGFSQCARNFISVFIEDPPCIDVKDLKSVPSSKIGYIKLRDANTKAAVLSILSGEFYFWYWLVRGDGFDVTSWIVSDFISCLKSVDKDIYVLLSSLGDLLHERRFEALAFKKNAGKYVGNFNYRCHFAITRRADLLLSAGLDLSRHNILEIFNYVQRVLSINVYAGEKGIPQSVKEIFSPLEVDEKEQQKLFDQVDELLKDHYGFTDEELDFIINYDIKYRMGDTLFE